MPSFELSLSIGRPPEDVFAYLTDVTNLPEWQSSAVSAEADGDLRVGARIRERRHFMGREVRTELEVTACDPPRRFEVRSRGGRVRYRIAHTLEPREGRTALHVAVDVEVGSMMRIAAQGPLKMAEREFRQDFERLKEILQSRPISDS